MTMSRTSLTGPINVDWRPVRWLGKVGLGLVPGRQQLSELMRPGNRDISGDIERLRRALDAAHLMCLVLDEEPEGFGIEPLEQTGVSFHRVSLQEAASVREVLALPAVTAEVEEKVIPHCRVGLGRAASPEGFVQRLSGPRGVETVRGPRCPEVRRQRPLIETFLPAAPSRRSRFVGAVLGAAVGDALGHPVEFVLGLDQIRERFGQDGVRGFELWWERDGQRFAPYSDDTQLAEVVLRTLVAGGRGADLDGVMGAMAAGFVEWCERPQGGHRSPGHACLRGSEQLRNGVHWREAGGLHDGGCGSVMRAYPFGLMFHDDLQRAETWAVEHSRMTHRDPIALAACAALSVGVGLEVQGARPSAVLAAMVEAAGRHDAGTARMAEQALGDAAEGAVPEVVLTRLQGWAAHEAISAAMYVVARHERDLRGALLEGANAPGDSDSIATLAGALLGARLGLEAVPAEWVRDVERSEELRGLGQAAAEVVERG